MYSVNLISWCVFGVMKRYTTLLSFTWSTSRSWVLQSWTAKMYEKFVWMNYRRLPRNKYQSNLCALTLLCYICSLLLTSFFFHFKQSVCVAFVLQSSSSIDNLCAYLFAGRSYLWPIYAALPLFGAYMSNLCELLILHIILFHHQ